MSRFRLIVSLARRLRKLLRPAESDKGSTPKLDEESVSFEALGEYREALRIALEQSRYLDGLVTRTATLVVGLISGRALVALTSSNIEQVSSDVILSITTLAIAGLLCLAAFATRSFLVPVPKELGEEDPQDFAAERLRLNKMCVDNAREYNFHKRTIILIAWILVAVAISLFTVFQVLEVEFDSGFWKSLNAWGGLVAVALPSLLAVAFLSRQLYKSVIVQPDELSDPDLVINLEGEGFPAKIWNSFKALLKSLYKRFNHPSTPIQAQSEP